MAFTQEVMNYDSLLAGPTQVIATVPLAASQTVKRGDLLVAAVTIAAGASASTIAASFSKAAAAAAPGNLHMIAAEDVTPIPAARDRCWPMALATTTRTRWVSPAT